MDNLDPDKTVLFSCSQRNVRATSQKLPHLPSKSESACLSFYQIEIMAKRQFAFAIESCPLLMLCNEPVQ